MPNTHRYYFVDMAMNRIDRVTAPNMDVAWRKYIDQRIRELPIERLMYAGPINYTEIQEDLEHDIFVLDESEVREL